ncbi:MAG: hypothetical protein ABWX83_05670 [Luteibacter sp.]
MLILAGALALATTACATVARAPKAVDLQPMHAAIVADVVEAMAGLWPPRATILAGRRETLTPLDMLLMKALSARGFTVRASGSDEQAFDCVVDPIGDSMYRVSVRRGTSRLSRLWVWQGDRIYPGGAWVRGD